MSTSEDESDEIFAVQIQFPEKKSLRVRHRNGLDAASLPSRAQ